MNLHHRLLKLLSRHEGLRPQQRSNNVPEQLDAEFMALLDTPAVALGLPARAPTGEANSFGSNIIQQVTTETVLGSRRGGGGNFGQQLAVECATAGRPRCLAALIEHGVRSRARGRTLDATHTLPLPLPLPLRLSPQCTGLGGTAP